MVGETNGYIGLFGFGLEGINGFLSSMFGDVDLDGSIVEFGYGL